MFTAQTSSPYILIERRRGQTARLVINRPPLNVMDIPTLRVMRAVLGEMERNPEIRMFEITGSSERAFSAGTDIRDHTPDRAPEMLNEFHSLIRAVWSSRLVSFAVVRGHCLGGGMELAMSCDFVLASDSARFGQPEIHLGVFPPVAAVLLPRLIPEKCAMEMILTGEPISAEKACRLGLVNRVAPDEDLEGEVTKFCDALLVQSTSALALARKAAGRGSRAAIESALRESERIYLEELLSTYDAKEGVAAFLDKRPPRWKQSE